MKLYCIRHAEHKPQSVNPAEAELTPNGVSQVEDLLNRADLPHPDVVLSSDFVRAKQTARIIVDHFETGIDIRECLGEWKLQAQDLTREEYKVEEKKGREDPGLEVLGGESLVMAQERIYDCIETICRDYSDAQTLIIVGHGTVFYALFKKILNEEMTFESEIENTGYGILEYEDGAFEVVKNIIP